MKCFPAIREVFVTSHEKGSRHSPTSKRECNNQVVVSNVSFYFHHCLGKWCNLTGIFFQRAWFNHLSCSKAKAASWWADAWHKKKWTTQGEFKWDRLEVKQGMGIWYAAYAKISPPFKSTKPYIFLRVSICLDGNQLIGISGLIVTTWARIWNLCLLEGWTSLRGSFYSSLNHFGP